MSTTVYMAKKKETFYSEVTKFSGERLHIEIPAKKRKKFGQGKLVKVSLVE